MADSQTINDDTVRDCIRHLKGRFLGWRTPPIELPAESVIEEVVRYILHRADTPPT